MSLGLLKSLPVLLGCGCLFPILRQRGGRRSLEEPLESRWLVHATGSKILVWRQRLLSFRFGIQRSGWRRLHKMIVRQWPVGR